MFAIVVITYKLVEIHLWYIKHLINSECEVTKDQVLLWNKNIAKVYKFTDHVDLEDS